jgi:hypothetical protein
MNPDLQPQRTQGFIREFRELAQILNNPETKGKTVFAKNIPPVKHFAADDFAGRFCLEKKSNGRTKERFFESGGKVSAFRRSNVREPGVNPGRLRHCNGYNSQCHCPRAGRREEARSRSQDTDLIALVGPAIRGTSPQREG